MVQQFGLHVVQSQRQFLVFLILVEVAVRQISTFLLGYDVPHQGYGRVVFTTVAGALLLHRHLLQCLGVRLQRYKKLVGVVTDVHRLGLIAYSTESQFHSLLATDDKTAVQSGNSYKILSFILYGDECHVLATIFVHDMAVDNPLCHSGQPSSHQQH